jgi:hypothetical protein
MPKRLAIYNCSTRQRCQEKDVSTQGRPWLDALRSLEERALKEEKRNTNTVLSSVEENPESPLQRGDKSARSSTPSPDGEETCGVNTLQPRHRSRLKRADYEVRYLEFEGGHVVPPEIGHRAVRWFVA